MARGLGMGEMGFLLSVFAIIDHLNKSELTTTTKKLIMTYIQEAPGATPAEKARSAVYRYAHVVLPALEALREKSRIAKLDKLDHLVLKMEYQASRYRG
jgi:hypothetical protein